jgi:penicillin amidase
VIGAGEPALPGIAIGHNGHAALSLTIAPIDQEDLFVCEKHPDDPDQIRRGEGWERIRRVGESIPVRGGPDELVTLSFTRHGPILAEDAARAFALASVWSEPGAAAYLGSLAYLDVRTPEAFGQALRHWSAPSVNQLYADAEGRIAWFMAGKAPRRPAHDGLLPVPGDGRFDWAGFLDPAELPSSIDPAAGWIATANEMNLPPGYPAEARKVGFEWHEPWRADRIRAALGDQTDHRLTDSQALQADAFSEPALRIARLACTCPADDRPAIRAAQDMLRDFDGVLAADSAAAALVEVLWVRHLRPALIEALVPDRATRRLIPPGDAQSLIERLEGLAPEPRDDLLGKTLAAAWTTCAERMGEDPSAWAWGRLHRALFAHPLSALGGREWDVGPFPIGGAGASPMHAEYRTDTFRITHGASFRMVVDVGAWDASTFVNVPGQSGDPRSPHYRDLAEVWARQGQVPMPYSREAVEAATRRVIRLTPETGA